MDEIRVAHEQAKLELADAVMNTPEGGSLRVMGACGTTYRKVTAGDRFAAKEKLKLRYPEESTNRENPLRIGIKHIKVKGVEYPFVAVSDHWRPALLHENRLVWIHHYREIKGLRKGMFKVYYAVVKVPYNRLPWTVDNACFGGGDKGREFESLKEALDVAMILAEDRERMIEVASRNSVAEAGRKGGLVKSEKKVEKSRANGAKGGRRRSFSALDMGEGNQE